jgi:hypothetical protein
MRARDPFAAPYANPHPPNTTPPSTLRGQSASQRPNLDASDCAMTARGRRVQVALASTRADAAPNELAGFLNSGGTMAAKQACAAWRSVTFAKNSFDALT